MPAIAYEYPAEIVEQMVRACLDGIGTPPRSV